MFLAGSLSLFFDIHTVKAEPGTIYIRADGSIDPSDAPISTFDNVTYTLTGNITSDADGIVVERDNIVVDGAGYTVQGTGASGSKGIGLSGRSNVTIKNMIIRYFWEGIILEYSSNNTISENKVTNNSFGIALSESNHTSLSGNNITANNDGVILEFSFNNVLKNNNMFDDNYNFGVYGYDLSQFVNDVDVSNTVDGKPIYYWVNEVDRVVPMDAGCVVLVNSTRITVRNLNLTKNSQGIRLAFTTNSTIAENSIANNDDGIRLEYSSNNSISGNNITNHSDGIYLVESSNDNTISGNNITANIRYGIMFYGYSNNNSISGNNVANSFDGIYLDGSNNDISGNNITANIRCGIRLYYSPDNNSISGNHIANNQYGIGLEGSSGNMFYHNNFINNINQVYSSDSVNVWDDGYPSGGNYWSNYAGVDAKSGFYQNETGCDGIGDAPYVVETTNIDNYPLIAPISFFNAGTWKGITYYVDIVSNSTLSHFHFNPDEGAFASFWVKGETVNEALGFCRVAIPKNLLWVEDGWTVLYGSYPLSYKTYSDENYTYLYFTYTNPSSNGFTSFTTVTINGTHVILEFPSSLILPLFMIVTLLAVIAYRKKYAKISGSP